MLTITKQQARRFLIRYHGLDKLDSFGKHKKGIMNFLDRVGSIQYDPLNIVGRNPEIVLFSRFSNTTRNTLNNLLYQDRVLVDGYDKEVCIYPMKQYPCFKRVRQHFAHGNERTIEYRHQEEIYPHIEDVYQAFIQKAPCAGKDLSSQKVIKDGWGNSRLASVILDYLYAHEKIGIHSRNGSMKIYDKIENLIPASLLNEKKDYVNDEDFIEWYLLRRINSIGFYWERQGPGWQGLYLSKTPLRKKAIQSLLDKNLLTEFQIEGSKYHYYVDTQHLSLLQSSIRLNPFVRFIAPLDNFIWDRQMIEELFDFNYRWEVYKPIEERSFGYYVLPILYKDKLVGRFDPKRQSTTFEIDQTWWEEGFIPDEIFNQLFILEKERFAQWLESHEEN